MASRRRRKKSGAIGRGHPEKELAIWSENTAVLHVKGLEGERMRRVLCGNVRTEGWDGIIAICNERRAVVGGVVMFLANVAPCQDISQVPQLDRVVPGTRDVNTIGGARDG